MILTYATLYTCTKHNLNYQSNTTQSEPLLSLHSLYSHSLHLSKHFSMVRNFIFCPLFKTSMINYIFIFFCPWCKFSIRSKNSQFRYWHSFLVTLPLFWILDDTYPFSLYLHLSNYIHWEGEANFGLATYIILLLILFYWRLRRVDAALQLLRDCSQPYEWSW